MENLKGVSKLFEQVLNHLYEQDEILHLCRMTYCSITGRPAVRYALEKNNNLTTAEYEQYINVLNQLKTGRPIQYILGKADFYGNTFLVNEYTLIPRPETEELVDWIVRDLESSRTESLTILDIGTGSGCIAISLQKRFPRSRILALDVSAEAIKISRQNAKELESNIEIIETDILEWDTVLANKMNLDIIVSNPPYITPSEQAEMHNNVLLFEPHSALFVEEHNPLVFYSTIADFGNCHLNPNGLLYFEINQHLGADTCDLLRKKGYKNIEIRKDINHVDRMIKAQLSP